MSLKGFALGMLALSLAATVAAQTTQTKETVPGGAPKVTTVELKGEVVATGSTWLIAKDAAGVYHVYDVKPGRKAIVDGVPKTVDQLRPGTMLTAKYTTTETPLVTRTTKITKGTVFWASSTLLIATLENGENKEYQVPSDFKFDVEGKQLSTMELKPGMKLSATRIVEVPHSVITEDIMVTGTAPKK